MTSTKKRIRSKNLFWSALMEWPNKHLFVSLKFALSIFLALGLFACQDVVRPAIPEQIIPEAKMADLLVEAYIGNAARSNNNRVLRMGGVQLDSILYAKYEIDSLQFAQNTAYYAAQIDPYMRILQQVETKLSVVKKSLDSLALIDAEQQKKDKESFLDSAKTDVLNQKIIPAISQ
ncbi:MAG: DUF4296 domain-containing protein [Flavobacteriaceae bacterium]|nr:DUF4296 domain-containing protein [Flavobacteriaceae bacterium]